MTDELLAEIRAHAEREYPRESCGLVIIRKGRARYIPCRNLATGTEHFEMHAEDAASAEEAGEVTTVIHSHPNIAPLPSQADLVGCEASGLPWVIVNWPTGDWHRFEPSGYRAPLVGRVFSHGILDCYTLIRDYYRETLQIALPDFPRSDNWWHRGEDLYRRQFAEAGFHVVPDADLRTHDVLLMQLSANVANHGAVYLGDDRILHHPMSRLSGRDVYGGYWKQITVLTLRHKMVRDGESRAASGEWPEPEGRT